MLIFDAKGKYPVAPGVFYVIHKYVYKNLFFLIWCDKYDDAFIFDKQNQSTQK